MTKQEILKWYNSKDPAKFMYGLMYGTRNKLNPIEEDITELNYTNLELSKNEDCFIFIWGWPGPDVNFYEFNDYGVTWSFSKEELINYWREKYDSYKNF